MAGIVEHVADVLLPVLICVLLGYFLSLIKARFDTKLFGDLVSNIGYPTLVISHLAKEHIQLSTFALVMVAAGGLVLIFAVLGYAALRILRVPVRAYLGPMMLANVGSVGLPVATLAFGPQGAAVTIGFIAVILAAIFTIGIALPMGKPDLRALAKQPVIYAVLLSLVMMATGWKLPKPIEQSFDILAGLTIPVMLLTLGYSLGTLKLGGLTRAIVLSLVHIVLSAIAAFLITTALGLEGRVQSIVILLCFMPPSAITYLPVARYQPDEAPGVAGFVLVSTLMTLVTLPIVLTFWATG
ncbi:AEC family transporter [Roseibium sp. MMSF_3544]|uniref:AEC family transporter n=1 Tax=unclassified Roseibium TaxID=2629323 RepID=UPI0027400739|nr:AEC family transporter [Roseibium sp. MMSF_3544]